VPISIKIQKFSIDIENLFKYNFIMKTRKPRNHVVIALMKRGGAGSHQKSHKQLRGKWKRSMEL
jgi:hypothetical protein